MALQPESKAKDVNGSHIPETGKAGVVVDNGPNFRCVVEDVPVPQPGPGELLLRLNATGLCFSDIHYMLEDLPMPKMSAFGVVCIFVDPHSTLCYAIPC